MGWGWIGDGLGMDWDWDVILYQVDIYLVLFSL